MFALSRYLLTRLSWLMIHKFLFPSLKVFAVRLTLQTSILALSSLMIFHTQDFFRVMGSTRFMKGADFSAEKEKLWRKSHVLSQTMHCRPISSFEAKETYDPEQQDVLSSRLTSTIGLWKACETGAVFPARDTYCTAPSIFHFHWYVIADLGKLCSLQLAPLKMWLVSHLAKN